MDSKGGNKWWGFFFPKLKIFFFFILMPGNLFFFFIFFSMISHPYPFHMFENTDHNQCSHTFKITSPYSQTILLPFVIEKPKKTFVTCSFRTLWQIQTDSWTLLWKSLYSSHLFSSFYDVSINKTSHLTLFSWSIMWKSLYVSALHACFFAQLKSIFKMIMILVNKSLYCLSKQQN